MRAPQLDGKRHDAGVFRGAQISRRLRRLRAGNLRVAITAAAHGPAAQESKHSPLRDAPWPRRSSPSASLVGPASAAADAVDVRAGHRSPNRDRRAAVLRATYAAHKPDSSARRGSSDAGPALSGVLSA